MLLFIYKNRIFQNQWNHVSIHHMLLFIKCTVEPPLFVSTFQYITCYSLSQAPNPFYHLQSWFQYITCYSLSVIGLVTVHTCERFNTSHVTLYPAANVVACVTPSFQYITCYSLSHTSLASLSLCEVSIHHMLLFINSGSGKYSVALYVSIHHMLLFII